MLLSPYHIKHPKLNNFESLCHYVHCFPFRNTSYSNNLDEVSTPNLMMTKQYGNSFEHAILLASTMMGLKDDESNKKRWNEIHKDSLVPVPYVKIRERVFVCIGLDKFQKKKWGVKTGWTEALVVHFMFYGISNRTFSLWQHVWARS